MFIRLLPLLAFGLTTITFAYSETQTDWSGYDGMIGPYTSWGTNFAIDTDIGWYTTSELVLPHLKHTVDIDSAGIQSVDIEDVNGDGYLDILGASFSGVSITWWENVDGSATNWVEHAVDWDYELACSIHSEDVNGDGYMDILGTAWNSDNISWWENLGGSGTSWTRHTVTTEFDGAQSVYSVDVNADGYLDVLGAANTADEISWWENLDGSGTSWMKHIVTSEFDGATSVYSADINGDGHLDAIGAGYQANSIKWWENVDGSGTSWTEHCVAIEFESANSVYTADINGDGYMDVLGAANTASEITWWENLDGSGTSWVEHIVDDDYYGAHSAYSEDVNGDGYMDILGVASYDDEITWWENVDGSGLIWTEHLIDRDFLSPSSVCAADLNEDGHMDIIAASFSASWWDLTKYSSEGSLESSCLDLQINPSWGSIDWIAQEPAGSSVSFLVRSTYNPDMSTMGPWSDTLHTPCSLSGVLADGDRYFQYKTILQTSDPSLSPVLEEITLTCNPLGIGETDHETKLFSIKPNPSAGAPVISFWLQEQAYVGIYIFDLSGRLVSEIVETEYPSGSGSLYLNELNPGIYFCRMISADFTATQKFVVIQ